MSELVSTPFAPDIGTLQDVERGYHRPPSFYNPRTILDLGANVGLTLRDFGDRFPETTIAGVELDHANYEIARHNIRDYPKVWVVWGAVAMWNGRCDYNRGAASNAFQVGPEAGGSVPCRTLDGWVELLFPTGVDYVKVDIEGMEKNVFKAGGEWPRRVRFLSVETHYGYEPAEAMEDLTRLGYETRIYNYGPPGPEMHEHWVVWAAHAGIL